MVFGEGPGSPTTFFCGAYTFAGELCAGLLAGLPDLTVVRPRAGSGLRATLDVFAGELLHDAPGRDGGTSLAAVARSLGYASEFSFAAAFNSHHRMPPGRWRTAAARARTASGPIREPRAAP